MKKYHFSIHQFTRMCVYGDGITKGILLTQKILSELGFESKIYILINHIDIRLKTDIYHLDEYIENPKNVLLFHASIGDHEQEKIFHFLDRKILVYHNITPSHFFDGKAYQERCDLGRMQFEKYRDCFVGAYADSEYNARELRSFGYKHVEVLPLLVDLKPTVNETHPNSILEAYKDSFNILFVGRVIQNKCQHELINVLYELKSRNITNIKLFLVGGNHYTEYFQFLFKYRDALGLNEDIIITDKVTEDDLAAYYKVSDVYVSLSEHEGFGMPLLEAILNDVPVLAYDTSAISSTIGNCGLLHYKSTDYVVENILKIKENQAYREEILNGQKDHLKEFEYDRLKKRFYNYLKKYLFNSAM